MEVALNYQEKPPAESANFSAFTDMIQQESPPAGENDILVINKKERKFSMIASFISTENVIKF